MIVQLLHWRPKWATDLAFIFSMHTRSSLGSRRWGSRHAHKPSSCVYIGATENRHAAGGQHVVGVRAAGRYPAGTFVPVFYIQASSRLSSITKNSGQSSSPGADFQSVELLSPANSACIPGNDCKPALSRKSVLSQVYVLSLAQE